MFVNEVMVLKEDKDLIVNYLEKAQEILDKYPLWKGTGKLEYSVATITRAKLNLAEALKWCKYLET